MFEHLTDKHESLLNCIPFVSMAITHRSTPLATRLVETVLMAVIAFAGTLYVAVPLIQQDIAALHVDVARVDSKVDKVDGKVEKLREDLYAPKSGIVR